MSNLDNEIEECVKARHELDIELASLKERERELMRERGRLVEKFIALQRKLERVRETQTKYSL